MLNQLVVSQGLHATIHLLVVTGHCFVCVTHWVGFQHQYEIAAGTSRHIVSDMLLVYIMQGEFHIILHPAFAPLTNQPIGIPSIINYHCQLVAINNHPQVLFKWLITVNHKEK